MFSSFFAGMAPQTKFERTFAAYSNPYTTKYGDERGGNVILPSSALDQLMRMQITGPMLFQLQNPNTGMSTHSGVLEFVADEGKMLLPPWVLQNLGASEGDMILVSLRNLVKGTFVKLQPETSNFLKVSNPRVVLERGLRSYSAISQGDRILIPYGSQRFYMRVIETKPSDSICIIQTDLEVDFEAPVDYKEPVPSPTSSSVSIPIPKGTASGESTPKSPSNTPDVSKPSSFTGAGYRLDGRPSSSSLSSSPHPAISSSPGRPILPKTGSSPSTNSGQQPAGAPRPIPGYGTPSSPPNPNRFPPGSPTTGQGVQNPAAQQSAAVGSPKDNFVPFSGKGHSLK